MKKIPRKSPPVTHSPNIGLKLELAGFFRCETSWKKIMSFFDYLRSTTDGNFVWNEIAQRVYDSTFVEFRMIKGEWHIRPVPSQYCNHATCIIDRSHQS